MNQRLLELAHKRGRLSAQIQSQREALARDAWPLEAGLRVADSGAAGLHWLKDHPGVVGSGVAIGLMLRPKRVFRWLRRGYLAWKGYTLLRQRLDSLGRQAGR
ncbi:MAG: YqjK-like family protein [Betaproteobacteria bacterium]|nr:YqjK-like family protein [Betaproteobacteria bacterium]